jgi:Flp pilus assembly protein TadD
MIVMPNFCRAVFLPFFVLVFASFLLSACATNSSDEKISSSENAGLVKLAERLRGNGDIPGAMDFYQRAIERDPNDPKAYLALADLLEKQNNQEAAEKLLDEATQTIPRHKELMQSYGRLLMKMQKYDFAKDQFERVLMQDEQDAKALNGLAVAEDYLGNHDGALAAFQKAFAAHPDDLNTRSNLGFAYILRGELAPALDVLTPIEKEKEATAAMRQNLALAYGLLGQEEDAKRVARMDLTGKELKNNLAYYKEKRSQYGFDKKPASKIADKTTEEKTEPTITKVITPSSSAEKPEEKEVEVKEEPKEVVKSKLLDLTATPALKPPRPLMASLGDFPTYAMAEIYAGMIENKYKTELKGLSIETITGVSATGTPQFQMRVRGFSSRAKIEEFCVILRDDHFECKMP